MFSNRPPAHHDGPAGGGLCGGAQLSHSSRGGTMRALALLFALGCGTNAFAQCRPPHYQRGFDFINPQSGLGSLYVSIRAKDFALRKLTCLAQSLRKSNPNWKAVSVLVFDSNDAAEHFLPAPIEVQRTVWAQWAGRLHAAYFLNTDKREDYLEIMPLGYEESPSYGTRIDLPITTKPSCSLELSERCVLLVDDVDYPSADLRANGAGTVSLEATVNADGTIAKVLVIDADVHPTEAKHVFADAALKNLETWRFDASASRNPIRITYSYVLDNSLRSGSRPEVQWDPPNRIVIRGKPPE